MKLLFMDIMQQISYQRTVVVDTMNDFTRLLCALNQFFKK